MIVADQLLKGNVQPDVYRFQYLMGNDLRSIYGIRFAYIVVFNDNYYYPVFDDFSLAVRLVTELKHGCLFCEKEVTGYRTDGYRIAKWSKMATSDNMRIYTEVGIGNGITVFKVHPDRIETWCFMCEHFEDKQEWLIENVNLCVDYARCFNNISATLNIPKTCIKSKLFPLESFDPINDGEYSVEDAAKKAFLNKLRRNGVYLTTESNVIRRITPREVEVCSRIPKMYHTKLIANDLNISTKVTERHIDSVKNKIGASSKAGILELCNNQHYFI